MDSQWKEFDKINDAHAYIVKVVNKIERKKTQRIVGKTPAQYIVECGTCKQPCQISYAGIKGKEFTCFDCLSKE